MIFCQYGYKDYHNGNSNIHPIKGNEGWCKMVNDNYRYCDSFNWHKWALFYFYVFVGRVQYHNLPSFHPYWKQKVRASNKILLAEMMIKYNKCMEDPSQIKFYFNGGMSIGDVKREIELLKRKC